MKGEKNKTGSVKGDILSKQKGHSLIIGGNALFNSEIVSYKLNHGDIYRSRTFFALLYVKGNSVAFIEGLKTGCIDS